VHVIVMSGFSMSYLWQLLDRTNILFKQVQQLLEHCTSLAMTISHIWLFKLQLTAGEALVGRGCG